MEKIYQNLYEELSIVCEERISSLAMVKRTEAKTNNQARIGDEFFYSKTALVRIEAPSIAITFQSFFNPADIFPIIKELDSNPSQEFAVEFCAEFVNIIGGVLNGALEKSTKNTVRGVPIVKDTADKPSAPSEDNIKLETHLFRITMNNASILCKTLIEYDKKVSFESLKLLDQPEDMMFVI